MKRSQELPKSALRKSRSPEEDPTDGHGTLEEVKKRSHFMYSSAVDPALASRTFEEKQRLLIDDLKADTI